MRDLYLIVAFLFVATTINAQVDKSIVVEHYTNTLCGTCAAKNPAFFELLDNNPDVIHIAYHPSSPYSACIFSQHNVVENDARTNFYGVYGGTPRAVLQGEVLPPSSPLVSQGQLDGKAGGMSDFSLTISQQPSGNDSMLAVIVVKRVSNTSQEGLNLYAVLAERSITYAAPNGESLHRNVFRKVLIDQEISLPDVNDSVVISKKYLPHADWINDEIRVISILQSVSDKSILQAGRSEVSTSIEINKVVDLSASFYPNPVASFLYFAPESVERFKSARLYTFFGTIVSESDAMEPLDMRSLLPGYYFLVLTDKSGKSFSAKVVKSGN